jgi:hypothetical protein
VTRREQFIIRRNKFIRRAERARNINTIWDNVHETGKTRRLGKRVVWESTGLQMPCRVGPHGFHWMDYQPFGLPYVNFTISKIGPRRPPHVSVDPPLQAPGPIIDTSRWFPVIGYHKRRVKRYGRKPNRLTKFQRSIWLASMHANREGWFPEWDPLQRHPNPEDIANGAPYVSEVPYVPDPWPTGPTE